MFKFFNHNRAEVKTEPETKTTNSSELVENQEASVDNSEVELSYINPEYEIAENRIDLDPSFFITELEAALPDVPETNEGVETRPDFSDFIPQTNVEDMSVVEKDSKNKGDTNMNIMRRVASLGVAVSVAFLTACNKTKEKDHTHNSGANIEKREGNISQKGPGEKFAKILKEIIPSGDVVNGNLMMNETTLSAISSGALVYDPKYNVFCVETMKDRAHQGIPVDTFVYYLLAKKLEPRPAGGSLGGVKPFVSYTHNRNFATFNYDALEKDIVESVDKNGCKNAKGDFNKKLYKDIIFTLKDADFAMVNSIIEWHKQRTDDGRGALYQTHVEPYLNRQ